MYSDLTYLDIVALIQTTRPLVLNRVKAAQITKKGRSDFATEVDYEVQRYMQQQLRARYPDIQFFAEEGDAHTVDVQCPFWILDPIDGTTNLIHGYQQSCVALALWDGSRLVFGACYNPFHDETFVAERGKGAYCNQEPIQVSSIDKMEHSLSVIGTSPYEREKTDRVFAMAKRLFQNSEDIRRAGSAELDMCYVACGRTDCFIEYNLKAWDYAAGTVILEEAGGCVSNCEGQKPTLPQNSDICCSNGLLHRRFLEIVNDEGVQSVCK